MTVTTFLVAANADDDGVQRNSSSGEYPPVGSYFYQAGDTTQKVERAKVSTVHRVAVALLRFNTSTLPDADTITAAELEIYVTSSYTGDARSIRMDWYTWTPPATSAHWTSSSGTTASGSVAMGSIATGAAYVFPLDNVAANVSNTGYTGLRIYVSGGAPTGPNSLEFASRENTAYAEPKLRITHGSLTSSGAVLLGAVGT